MFLVTNRKILKNSGDWKILGDTHNAEGANELRLVEANKRNGKWRLDVLPDTVSTKMRDAVQAKDRHILSYVTAKLLDQVNPQARNRRSKRKGKNLLVFVHGFNNDVKDVLERSRNLSETYGLEVLAFSWPANGRNVVIGTASYKSDKRDARLSAGALDRLLQVIGERLHQITDEAAEKVRAEASAKFPQNQELATEYLVKRLDSLCPFTVNLMLHSMGNYLYKHMLLSTASEGKGMIFDNVVLVAADTNNYEHSRWLDAIRARRRVYVTINEDDGALQAARLKTGDDQLARLGHYPFDLNSKYAAYVQFTDASKVGSSHAYFEGGPIANPKVKRFFSDVLNGRRADARLRYDAASNTYRI